MSLVTNMSHVGVAVSDIDISLRFYTEGLGFTLEQDFVGDDAFSKVMELEEFEGHPHFLSNGGQTIELVAYMRPPLQMSGGRRPMNTQGFTHMCFWVEDVDAVGQRLEELGGSILDQTRMETDKPDGIQRTYLVCLDPDGVRIELVTGAMPE